MIEAIFVNAGEERIGSNVRVIQDILNGLPAKDSLLRLLFICKECIDHGDDRFPERKNGIINLVQGLFDTVINQLEEYEPDSEYES